MRREATETAFSDDGGPGVMDRLLADAPPGSFVTPGKRVEKGVESLTLTVHWTGVGSQQFGPLALVTEDGRPVSYQTAFELLAAIAVETFVAPRRKEKDRG